MFMQISAGWCHQLSRKPNQCTVVLKSNLILLVPTVECLSFTVQSLTLQGCFHISLLNVYIFSVVIKNMICSRTSMICDITNRLEADPGPIFSKHMRKLEASLSAHRMRMDFTSDTPFLHIVHEAEGFFCNNYLWQEGCVFTSSGVFSRLVSV